MKRTIELLAITLLITAVISSCRKDSDEPKDDIVVPDGYSLVWSDEFNEGDINASNWTYETGDGTDYGLPVGWGNNELQIYTEDAANSGIEQDGEVSALAITALDNGGGNYTSAKLTTQNLQSVRFGRVEVSAKLPEGKGIWPAIWMLGENIDQIEWPGCGEIDLVEVIGSNPDLMYSTVHYTNGENSKGESQGTQELSTGTFSDSYHTFTLDWTPEELSFGVDGIEVHTVAIEDDMKEFLRSFYLIVNAAVGGYWPGDPDATTSFPQTMYIDYVRVFEKDDFTAPAAPALDIDEESFGQTIEPTLAQHAIKDDFTDLGNADLTSYGGGGEPVVSGSDVAIDGDSSVVFDYPGGNWGGAYMELSRNVDLSAYSTLKFALNKPSALVDGEVKLESTSTDFAVYLKDYTGTDVGNGFMEYSIPLSDFTGLDLSDIRIPFALWNVQDANQDFVAGTVYVDRLHFE